MHPFIHAFSHSFFCQFVSYMSSPRFHRVLSSSLIEVLQALAASLGGHMVQGLVVTFSDSPYFVLIWQLVYQHQHPTKVCCAA